MKSAELNQGLTHLAEAMTSSVRIYWFKMRVACV